MKKQRLTLKQLERIRAWDRGINEFVRNFGNTREPLPIDLADLEFEVHEDNYCCKERDLIFAKDLVEKDHQMVLIRAAPRHLWKTNDSV